MPKTKARAFNPSTISGINLEVARFSFENQDIMDEAAKAMSVPEFAVWLESYWVDGFEDLVADTPEFAEVPGIYVHIVKYAAQHIKWLSVAAVLIANAAE